MSIRIRSPGMKKVPAKQCQRSIHRKCGDRSVGTKLVYNT